MAACDLGACRALSPTTGLDDLAYILGHAEAQVLVTDRHALERAREAVARSGRSIALVCHDALPDLPWLWDGLDGGASSRVVDRAARSAAPAALERCSPWRRVCDARRGSGFEQLPRLARSAPRRRPGA